MSGYIISLDLLVVLSNLPICCFTISNGYTEKNCKIVDNNRPIETFHNPSRLRISSLSTMRFFIGNLTQTCYQAQMSTHLASFAALDNPSCNVPQRNIPYSSHLGRNTQSAQSVIVSSSGTKKILF